MSKACSKFDPSYIEVICKFLAGSMPVSLNNAFYFTAFNDLNYLATKPKFLTCLYTLHSEAGKNILFEYCYIAWN